MSLNYFKKLRNIATTIILLGAAIGVLFSANTYVAKAKDVQQLEIRLDQKILQDRISFLQDQVYRIQDRYGYEVNRMPQEVRSNYRRIKKELENAERQLDALTKKLE